MPSPFPSELVTGPPLAFRFAVTFFPGGTRRQNAIDIRFQRVSGLATTVETTPVAEGGQNLFTHQLPKRVSHGNLVLERGVVPDARLSPLRAEFEAAMQDFSFTPCNVMVMLLAEERQPLAAWMFYRAFPVRWATADLHATDERLLIETLELAYAAVQVQKV